MKLTVLVSEVASCSVTGCGYNVTGDCHARAITIGDDDHPRCDTYFPRSDHTAYDDKAGVGACKVTVCKHNRGLECSADAIRVDHHGDHPDCVTFAR